MGLDVEHMRGTMGAMEADTGVVRRMRLRGVQGCDFEIVQQACVEAKVNTKESTRSEARSTQSLDPVRDAVGWERSASAAAT
jgi:hypothetical protein